MIIYKSEKIKVEYMNDKKYSWIKIYILKTGEIRLFELDYYRYENKYNKEMVKNLNYLYAFRRCIEEVIKIEKNNVKSLEK